MAAKARCHTTPGSATHRAHRALGGRGRAALNLNTHEGSKAYKTGHYLHMNGDVNTKIILYQIALVFKIQLGDLETNSEKQHLE